jgi:hypothetical protein
VRSSDPEAADARPIAVQLLLQTARKQQHLDRALRRSNSR